MSDKIRVLVTGVGGRSCGNQILHALLLTSDKYHIVATDAEPFSFGLYETPYRYVVPLAKDPEYVRVMLFLVERERLQVILPGTEAENLVLSAHRDAFASAGCQLIASPINVVALCDDKKNVHRWLEANGFHTPRNTDACNWRELVAEVGFPVIGKPAVNTGGSRNVAILKDEKEVERFLFDTRDNSRMMIQEYVGSPEGEFTVGVLVSRSGDIIDSIVMHRKLIGLSLGVQRQIGGESFALSTGYSQGFLIRHQRIQKECERLALALGIRGPLNIQLRLVGEKVYIFEVHPRFSGTTSIRADAGFNEPDVLISNFLLGMEHGRLNYQCNVAAIRAFRSILVPVADLESVPRG